MRFFVYFTFIILQLFSLARANGLTLPQTYLLQEHFHLEDIQENFVRSNYAQSEAIEDSSYVELSAHHHNHRHSPEEPEHSHAHHNTNSHSQNIHFISGNHFHYIWQINTKYKFNRFIAQAIQEPFLDAVFRPPIS